MSRRSVVKTPVFRHFLVTVSALIVLLLCAQAANAAQAVIGMPFAGKWAYNTNVNPPYNDNNSSHPSVHASYGADWATDLYAAPGTDVRVRVDGSPVLTVTSVTNTSCGAGKRVRVSVNVGGAVVGSVSYEHLDTNIAQGITIANGSVVGKTKNWGTLSCYWVTNDSGTHAHVSFTNTTNYSCYVDKGNPGVLVTDGDAIGVLGSTNSGSSQTCSGIPGGGSPGTGGIISLLNSANTVYAKDSIGYGGWIQQTDPGTAKQIAIGGSTQILLNACNAVYAKSSTTGSGGWTQETDCGTAKAIAVSSTGVQMLINTCNAVYAKTGISVGGWIQETDCGTATDVAVGGNTQVLINACGAVYAKSSLGSGGWIQETACGIAKSVDVGSGGIQTLLTNDNTVYAKDSIGYGGWIQQTPVGTAKSIAVGGATQMLINACNAVYAKSGTAGSGGWIQETECGTAKEIAVGDGGRQVLINSANTVYAKDSIGYGGWIQQTDPGTATAIAAG